MRKKIIATFIFATLALLTSNAFAYRIRNHSPATIIVILRQQGNQMAFHRLAAGQIINAVLPNGLYDVQIDYPPRQVYANQFRQIYNAVRVVPELRISVRSMGLYTPLVVRSRYAAPRGYVNVRGG